MKNDLKLICRICGEIYESINTPTICNKCKYPLNIYFPEDIEIKYDEKLPGVYKYVPTLLYRSNIYHSLGEGDTPLIKKDKKLSFKLEYLNPSGSFKDRGAAIAVKIAYDYGFKCVVEDSSGNAGAAIALYSKTYGIESHVFIPRDAPENKKRFIELLGGNLHLARDRGEAFNEAVEYARKNNFYYIGHLTNPFFNIGLESIGIELTHQSEHIDNIFVPIGSGGLYLGIFNGIKRGVERGYLDSMPKIHPVEVEGYVRLQEIGKQVRRSKLGDGARVPGPPRKKEIINALEYCGGIPTWVTDEEISNSLKELIGLGFLVEPTSAAAYAAYKKLTISGQIGKDETNIIVLTGSGLKMINELTRIISND